MQWTEKQQQVIDTRDRNILVSAAAGSGKTAVLVARIIQMITDETAPVDIDQLLVVTFTRAAASEMKERIREALEQRAQEHPEDDNVEKQLSLIHNAHISTIDSFCASVVRDNFDKIDLDPNFRIADETEIALLQSDILEEMLEEYYEMADPAFMELAQQYSAGKISENLGEMIVKLYESASGNADPEQWVRACIRDYDYPDAQTFADAPVMQHLLAHIKHQMEGWIQTLQAAYTISESEEGPKYGKSLQKMMDMIEEVKGCQTFDSMRDSILQIGTVRLSGVRGCDEQKKQQVSAMKTEVAAHIKKMQSEIFAQSLEQIYQDVCHSKSSVDMLIRLTLDFMQRFRGEKAEKGMMDFNDQAHFALDILNEKTEDGTLVPSETAKQMARQFREIMIDEYQDSNFVQEAILSSITGGQGHGNMFMVGDVKQSIYRFRQAEPKLFLDKFDRYMADLESADCKIVLDKNFRSRREVIDSVNYLFDYIMHRDFGGIDYAGENQLKLGADYEEPPLGQEQATEFIMIEGEEKQVEAAYVAQKIREITDPETGMKITEKGQGMRPVRYGDIAILLRSMKGNSEIYQEQLEHLGIPSFAESRTGYYQAKEVQTIISALSVIDNPRQDIPLTAVMVSPMFGFTNEELAVMRTAHRGENFLDDVVAYGESGSDAVLAQRVKKFLAWLERFREMVPYTSVYELIDRLLKETGYHYYVKAMPNGMRRYFNIEALKEKAVAYDAISYTGLFNFVRYIEKLQYLDKDDGEASTASEQDNLVHIMSIHKSKGLQFPVVFVCNTNSRPRSDLDQIVTNDAGSIGVDYIDNTYKVKTPTILKRAIRLENKEEDMAESLRILYVALTRAKEKLYITGRTNDLEKLVGEFASSKYDQSSRMSYSHLMNGSGFMDWIGKTVGKNKAFEEVMAEDFTPMAEQNPMYDRDCSIRVKAVAQEEIAMEEMKSVVLDDIRKETLQYLKHLPQDEKVEQHLKKSFSYVYPHLEDVTRYTKASVTEIKKQSMAYEEEQDGVAVYERREAKVPEFMKEHSELEGALTGAERGTAYHRIFELLDMEQETYTVSLVEQMLEEYVAEGRIDRVGADAVVPQDIVTFTQTDLFGRMRAAHQRGELFRERKFLMGRQVKDMYADSNSEEMMIIQGIIDVCFLEDGRYVIADYKTDKVETMEELVQKYHVQLACYRDALEQIAGVEVKELMIYSVTLGEEISL